MASNDTWPPAITKAWFCFEALRRLGFAADDIHVGATRAIIDRATKAEGTVARVELRTQDRVFGIHVAPVWADTIEAFNESWVKFAAKVNGEDPDQFTESELQKFWDTHVAEMPIAELPMALIAKGFDIPMLGEIKSPELTWTGPRTVDQALEQHSVLIAKMAGQALERRLDPRAHLGLVIEHDHPGFNKLRNLIGVARDSSHGVLVLLVGREHGKTKLAAHGIGVPSGLLESADTAGALPLVICGPEGHGFGHAVANVELGKQPN